ncbi:calcium-binding protein [Microcoleus sp. F6_B4]
MATTTGTPGPDYFFVGPPASTVIDDIISGEAGNDSLWGWAGNDWLTGGIGNDWLKGDTGNDSLDGGSGNDSLDGGSGNDSLDGGSGNDSLDGGDGIDTVSYSDASTGINLRLGPSKYDNSGLGTDGLGGLDRLSGIEVVIGSNFNDTLVSKRYNNETLLGGRGNDSLWGGGNDLLNGGDGIDTVSYSDDDIISGIYLQLGEVGDGSGLGRATGSFDIVVGFSLSSSRLSDFVDSLSGIEVVIGSNGDDTLVGGSDNETLLGGSGNDSLSGLAGNDLLNGGDGIDTVSYSLGRTGVYLELGGVGTGLFGLASDGQGGVDSLSGLEVAIGSRYNDTLVGEYGSETLMGGGGDDLLFGRSGNDYLVGGRGFDKFRLWRSSGIDTVADFKQGEDKLLVRSRAPFTDIISESVINGSDTEIRQSGQIIGILKGVQITITASDLITG